MKPLPSNRWLLVVWHWWFGIGGLGVVSYLPSTKARFDSKSKPRIRGSLPRSSSREVRIRAPFFLQPILVGEPSPKKGTVKVGANRWGTESNVHSIVSAASASKNASFRIASAGWRPEPPSVWNGLGGLPQFLFVRLCPTPGRICFWKKRGKTLLQLAISYFVWSLSHDNTFRVPWVCEIICANPRSLRRKRNVSDIFGRELAGPLSLAFCEGTRIH